MKILISKYELKHPENESPVYICENINKMKDIRFQKINLSVPFIKTIVAVVGVS